VRSYRTFSPLPRRRSESGPRNQAHSDDEAVHFLWHFPSTGLEPGLPDVIRHTALRSSDFPPSSRRATVRSGCQQLHYMRWFPLNTDRGEASILLASKAA
jgi:hypothetical protein